MEQARNSIKSMTEGSPLRLLIRFALPLMLGNILQQLYVVVDTAIVGQGLGVTALASVGAADWLNWLVSGIARASRRVLAYWWPSTLAPRILASCKRRFPARYCFPSCWPSRYPSPARPRCYPR